MIDYIFAAYFGVVSIFGAILNKKVVESNWPLWSSAIFSIAMMIGGIVMLQYSTLPLIKQSSIITLTSRFGYLIGLVLMGEVITSIQWIGIVIMLFGSYLTNK